VCVCVCSVFYCSFLFSRLTLFFIYLEKRSSRSELSGVEGIVKLKHLDDSTINVSIDTTDSSDALNPKAKLAQQQRNATLPFDAKLDNGNGFQDNELKR
jgi:hypothetical protein